MNKTYDTRQKLNYNPRKNKTKGRFCHMQRKFLTIKNAIQISDIIVLILTYKTDVK